MQASDFGVARISIAQQATISAKGALTVGLQGSPDQRVNVSARTEPAATMRGLLYSVEMTFFASFMLSTAERMRGAKVAVDDVAAAAMRCPTA